MTFSEYGSRTIIATIGLALGFGSGHTAVAQADTAQADTVQAEKRFREGLILLDQKKFAEACTSFEASQNLDRKTSTLVNLALCRELNRQLATAWRLFLGIESATRDAANDDSRTWHNIALRGVKRIEPRMSKLTIRVPADSSVVGLTISRGAELVEPAMWNSAMPIDGGTYTMPIDGGTYTITASASGVTPWTVEVTIAAERGIKVVEIPRLEQPAGTGASTTAGDPESGPSRSPGARSTPATVPGGAPVSGKSVADRKPDDAPGDGGTPSSTRIPKVIAGGGLALAAGALGFAVWGNITYDKARDELKNQARRDSLYSDANIMRHVALGMTVGGLACGAVATWLYLTGRTAEVRPTDPSRSVRIMPVVGASTGLVVAGGF